MPKKTILLFLILSGIIPIGCCPEQPEGPYLLQLNGIGLLKETFLTSKADYLITPGEAYSADTLVMAMSFNYSFASNSNYFSLHSKAVAFSCDQNLYFTSLSNPIKSIDITSDKPFNRINAGESLNSIVVSFKDSFKEPLTLLQTVERINLMKGYDLIESKTRILAITEKPTGAYKHTFTITITYESGTAETVQSTPVVW